MNSNQKNTALAVLAVAFVVTAATSLIAIRQSDAYKLSAMQSHAAAMQRDMRGANSGEHPKSVVPKATATGDVSAIIAAAKAQAEVDEKDNEDDPGQLSTLSDMDTALAGGVQ